MRIQSKNAHCIRGDVWGEWLCGWVVCADCMHWAYTVVCAASSLAHCSGGGEFRSQRTCEQRKTPFAFLIPFVHLPFPLFPPFSNTKRNYVFQSKESSFEGKLCAGHTYTLRLREEQKTTCLKQRLMYQH